MLTSGDRVQKLLPSTLAIERLSVYKTAGAAKRARVQRTMQNIDILDEYLGCVGWRIMTLIGVGEHSTVFEVACVDKMSAYNRSRGAVKITELVDGAHSFRNECIRQSAAAPYAPYIYHESTFRGINVCVMELMGETLSDFLARRRNAYELEQVAEDITRFLQFYHEKRITHGDLALFNIARRVTSNSFIPIDFGYAEADAEKYAPEVDVYRLIDAFFDPSSTQGSRAISPKNMSTFPPYFSRWCTICNVEKVSGEQAALAWSKAFWFSDFAPGVEDWTRKSPTLQKEILKSLGFIGAEAIVPRVLKS